MPHTDSAPPEQPAATAAARTFERACHRTYTIRRLTDLLHDLAGHVRCTTDIANDVGHRPTVGGMAALGVALARLETELMHASKDTDLRSIRTQLCLAIADYRQLSRTFLAASQR